MLQEIGFEIENIKKDSGTIETLAMIINTYICNDLVPRFHIPGLIHIVSITICCPCQIIALIASRLIPDQKRIYLNLVIRARKRVDC
jgi:hypothetical protein